MFCILHTKFHIPAEVDSFRQIPCFSYLNDLHPETRAVMKYSQGRRSRVHAVGDNGYTTTRCYFDRFYFEGESKACSQIVV